MISTPTSEGVEIVGHPDSEPEIVTASNESESPELVEVSVLFLVENQTTCNKDNREWTFGFSKC